MTPASGVTVASLLKDRSDNVGLGLELLAGQDGLQRTIASPHVQKIGLAFAGFHAYLRPGRVLVLGESEVRYLESLDGTARAASIAEVFSQDVPCVLITAARTPPQELLDAAHSRRMPVLRTAVATPFAIAKLTALLDDTLAVRGLVHGVLLDILGLGVMIVGDSGIGKSECALDLVVRGHRLVADDAVEVRRRGETAIIGTCPELIRHHMEIRGLGILNIRDLFGVAAIRTSKRVELVVHLERWDAAREYDRLGLDEKTHEILGLRVPLVLMPVASGRSLAILVEVAARNQLLRSRGLNAAQELVGQLDRRMEYETADTIEDEIERGDD
jgi:HPr kinase/phosphorylase